MKKSHYFVQNYEGKDNWRKCQYCGKWFERKVHNQKFCSRDCYHKNVKILKAMWFQQNKERHYKNHNDYMKRTDYYNTHIKKKKPPPEYKFKDLPIKLIKRIKYKRDIIIKRELMQLELLSLQVLSRSVKNKRIREFKKIPRSAGVKQERVDYIKEKLAELDLPFGDVYEINIPDEYENDIRETVTELKRKYKL